MKKHYIHEGCDSDEELMMFELLVKDPLTKGQKADADNACKD